MEMKMDDYSELMMDKMTELAKDLLLDKLVVE